MKTSFLFQARALLVAALLPVVASAAAESPAILLQKGIYAEEIEQNLDSAIKIYEQIAAEASTHRAVVAQAQYRLAVCYQKQGKKEQAIKLLNELVQASTGDTAVGKQARDTLVALGETPAAALSIRRVPLPFPVGFVWGFSADGRYVSYQRSDLDIFVGELATGKSWMVFHGVRDKEAPWTNALISPDSRRIEFDVRNHEGSTGIYVANLDGSERRSIYTCDPKAEEIWPLAWSPDGSRVFARISIKARTEAKSSLVAFDIKTGIRTEIVRPASQDPSREDWQLSPDARLLTRRKSSYPRTITVLNLVSGHEETVADTDANGVAGWMPNSKRLVFSKTSVDGIDLWAANLDDGKLTAPPERIFTNLGADRRPFVSRDGNLYYYTRQNNKSDSYELWAMEGFLATSPAVASARGNQSEIPPSELAVGINNSISDRKFGFAATMPAGWAMRNADRRNGKTGSILVFAVPEVHAALARIAYQLTTPWEVPGPGFPLKEMGPKPNSSTEIDAWMRKWQQAHTRGHLDRNSTYYVDYRTRPDSIVARTINGNRALSWTSDYKRRDQDWLEFSTLVFSETAYAVAWVQVPAANRDNVVPTFEELVASIRFSRPEN